MDYVKVLRAVLSRAGRALLVAWGVSLIAFALVRLVPGDPVQVLLGTDATAENVQRLREDLNLDGSVVEQYFEFVSSLSRGDLGTSIQTRQPVIKTVAETLPVTLLMVASSMTVATLIAVPVGLISGTSKRRWVGRWVNVASSVMLAIPSFVLGLVLLLLVAVKWELLPVAGWEPSFPSNLRYLILPGVSGGLALGMIFGRILSRSVRETDNQEFVETAIIWGLPRRIVFWRYLLRPSLAPVIGLMGYVIGASLAAAVILETVFSLPGVGTYLVRGVLSRDYPVVQGTLFVFGLIVVIVHFLADLTSGWIDPRTGAAANVRN